MTIHLLASDIVASIHNAPTESKLNLEDLVANKIKRFMAEQIFFSPCTEHIPIPILKASDVTALPSGLPSSAVQDCQHQAS